MFKITFCFVLAACFAVHAKVDSAKTQKNPSIPKIQEKIFELQVKEFNAHRKLAQILSDPLLPKVDKDWIKDNYPSDFTLTELILSSPLEVRFSKVDVTKLRYDSIENKYILNNYPLDLSNRFTAKERIEYISRVLKHNAQLPRPWSIASANAAEGDNFERARNLSLSINDFIRTHEKVSTYRAFGIEKGVDGEDAKLMRAMVGPLNTDLLGFEYQCGYGNDDGLCADDTLTIKRWIGTKVVEEHFTATLRASSPAGCGLNNLPLVLNDGREIKSTFSYQADAADILKMDDHIRVAAALKKCCGYDPSGNTDVRRGSVAKRASDNCFTRSYKEISNLYRQNKMAPDVDSFKSKGIK
ncbi:MAG: hypothetical protein H7326_11450 [Bdellovibrionaceae bacterium]|nr:hypothetical protein [Pseudobdellovibrionaceae bacterium]